MRSTGSRLLGDHVTGRAHLTKEYPVFNCDKSHVRMLRGTSWLIVAVAVAANHTPNEHATAISATLLYGKRRRIALVQSHVVGGYHFEV